MANLNELRESEKFIEFLAPHISNAQNTRISNFESQLERSLLSVTQRISNLEKIRTALSKVIEPKPKVRVRISSNDYMDAVRISDDLYEIVTDNYIILKEGDDE